MRQEVTRMHKGWALDTVTLHNEVLKTFKEDINVPPQVKNTLIVCLKGIIHYKLYEFNIKAAI